MEFKINDLKQKNKIIKNFSEIIDFSSKVKDDIAFVSPIKVEGDYNYDESTLTFAFSLRVSGYLLKLCAITLEPVKILVDFDTILFYTFMVTNDDSFPISGDTIKLDEEIWGEICLNIPTKVVKEGAFFSEKDNFIPEKENPFSQLREEVAEEEQDGSSIQKNE